MGVDVAFTAVCCVTDSKPEVRPASRSRFVDLLAPPTRAREAGPQRGHLRAETGLPPTKSTWVPGYREGNGATLCTSAAVGFGSVPLLICFCCLFLLLFVWLG